MCSSFLFCNYTVEKNPRHLTIDFKWMRKGMFISIPLLLHTQKSRRASYRALYLLVSLDAIVSCDIQLAVSSEVLTTVLLLFLWLAIFFHSTVPSMRMNTKKNNNTVIIISDIDMNDENVRESGCFTGKFVTTKCENSNELWEKLICMLFCESILRSFQFCLMFVLLFVSRYLVFTLYVCECVFCIQLFVFVYFFVSLH